MALKSRSSLWSYLHFVLRFIGLNGLVACAVGAALLFALDHPVAGGVVFIAGLIAVQIALLGELRGVAQAVFSHRGAAGVNVTVQVSLAAALVVGGNYLSFSYSHRFDYTRNRTFTLDESLREKLAQLRGDTDIIIYLQHVSFGQRIELRQDEYDQAAEKIIARKVEDLAEQFGELGPRFRVHVLDTQKRTYDAREKELAKISDELVTAIKKAPENSIFFYTRDTKKIQRLSFHDIYHLDKKKSKEANHGKGNLVLIDQGIKNFANKVFKIEEKNPRIGFAVIHGIFGQEGTDEDGMPALKQALAARGYEGRDIVLKQWQPRKPVALEYAESQYEVLDARKNYYERFIKVLEKKLETVTVLQKLAAVEKLEDANKNLVILDLPRERLLMPRSEYDKLVKEKGDVFDTIPLNDETHKLWVTRFNEQVQAYQDDIAGKKKRLAKTIEEQAKLPVENLAEQRRATDVRAQFNRLLADVDMLVLPRMTLHNLLQGSQFPPEVYSLDDAHVAALKDFMKSGKPVLFCLGPMLDPQGGDAEGDAIEKLIAELGIQMPNQTILFNAEEEVMAALSERVQMPNTSVEIPAALLEWTTSLEKGSSPAPILTSLRLTANGLGDKGAGGLKIRHPRPVYAVKTTWAMRTKVNAEPVGVAIAALSLPGPAHALAGLWVKPVEKSNESAVFLMTDAECWNEDRPFLTRERVPQFEFPKPDDPNQGTLKERRRGPFPIGVALEADIPDDWQDKSNATRPSKVRVAVLGHGGVFTGDKLSPMREKLFLDTANWLMGRENLLAHQSETWQYPRVKMDADTKKLWLWGALALPLLFVYLGMIVGLVRRMR